MSVIELRNKTAQSKKENGDYEVILNNKLSLSDKDSIYVKQSILDTKASSEDRLVIPKLNLKLGAYLYQQNVDDTYKFIGTGTNPPKAPVDNDVYFRSDIVSHGSYPNAEIAVSQVFHFTLAGGKDAWGGFTVTYEYKDVVDGLIYTTQRHIPPQQYNGSGASEVTTVPINQIYDVTYGFLIVSPTALRKGIDPYKDTYAGALDSQIINQDFFQRPTYTSELTLEAGSYTPDELCLTINRQLTDNAYYPPPTTTFTNSPFIAQTDSNDYFINSDCTYYYRIDNGNYYYGTSLIELAYDTDGTQRFFWNYLHFPYYDSTGKIAIGWTDIGGNKSLFTRAGGLIWNSLQAYTEDGKYYPFFEDTLGFDLSTLVCHQGEYKNFDAGGIIGNAPTIVGEQVGVSSTSGKGGISSVVDTTQTQPWVVPSSNFNVLSDKNEQIYATKQAFEDIDDFGYFLIEINGKFRNNFYTKEQNIRGVQSVVSRYYEKNSYTSGTSEGSLIYQHHGEPILLESFSVRILNSDKELASDLGEDSTIFLEIVKAPVEEEQPDEKKEEK